MSAMLEEQWRDLLTTILQPAVCLRIMDDINGFLCFCFQLGPVSGEPQKEFEGYQRMQIITVTVINK